MHAEAGANINHRYGAVWQVRGKYTVGGFYKDTGGSYVYVVKNDLAIKRNVVLGRKNSECFEVLSGLTPGERVITSSYENFDKEDTLRLSEIEELYE